MMNILLLEDSPHDADLTKRSLITSFPDCHIEIVATLEEARTLLRNGSIFDIGLLDMKLPDGNGLDLLLDIRQSEINMPVIMLTGSGNEEVAVAALKAGADDYVPKRQGYYAQLPGVIEYAIQGYRKNLQKKSEIIHVLYVEPRASDIDKTIRHLHEYAPNIHVDAVLTAEQALRNINDPVTGSGRYQVMLLDYPLSGINSLEVIKIIRQEWKINIPVILVTGLGNEEVAAQALKLGADDYLTKGENYLYRLPSMITNAYQLYDRKNKQMELAESEAKYRLLADNSGDVIFVLDLDLKYKYISPAVKILRGFDPEEAKEQDLAKVLTPDSHKKVIKLLSDILSRYHEKPLSPIQQKIIDLEVVRKDKTTVWTEVKLSMIMEDNKPTGILGVTRDITIRRSFMEDLIKAKEKAEESDRLKTAFLNNISHEIRTPMNAIVGFCGYLKNTALSHEKRVQFTDIIVQSSNQLLSVITDIISIASIEAGQEKIREEEIDLNAVLMLLKEQFCLKAAKQNIVLNLDSSLSVKPERILTDKTKLIQILTNLIDNSLKFTDEGQVIFGYAIRNNELEFFVEDTGIGIPPDMFDEVFIRFRQVDISPTRRYGGSGLGLSISKAFVELLGGKIWFTSTLGKGSVFHFTIPYKKAEKESRPVEIPSSGPVPEFKGNKILLVAEDQESNLILLEEILFEFPIQIIKANNGLEAVAICRSDRKIDLVLMDLKLPEMDGYEATRQIKKIRPDLPIIAQTAYSSEEDSMKAMTSGCTDFISKPLKKELLVSKIERYLWKS
jgi:PAS domain S-box-containing protein